MACWGCVKNNAIVVKAIRQFYQIRKINTGQDIKQAAWTRAVVDAEKIVGYPTSFLNLRSLLSDEISNIATYLKKLIESGHPLLTTAKKLVYPSDKLHQTRGLLVLLVSKATKRDSSDILPSQRSLAEITELIHTAHLIHNGVIDLKSNNSNFEFGNKMAVLCGDYLLAHACVELATLRNVKVVELMSQAISDMNTAEFVALPKENENPLEMWISRAKLRYGSLLANACRSCVILNDDSLGEQAYSFGLHTAVAWQASLELRNMKSAPNQSPGDTYSLASILQTNKYPHPSLNIQRDIQKLLNENIDVALNVLQEFPSNSATKALHNIVNTLKI